MRRALVLLLVCLTMAACGDKETPEPPTPPPTPDPGDPPGTVRVGPNDLLGWSQRAQNTAELTRFQYAVYVDGNRVALSNVSCDTSSGPPTGFACSAPLPQMTPGAHAIELVTFVDNGGTIVESGRTTALNIIVSSSSGLSPLPLSTSVTTAEGTQLVLERVVDGLEMPADLAFGPDGAILVAERRGTVRTIRDGVIGREASLDLSSEITLPNGGLLAIALDSEYAKTGFLYALYAASAPHDGQEFVLARFRGVRDSFAERAILLDRVPAAPADAGGALRSGPDGLLYVALDNAADDEQARSGASYNGKVLRLNADATVPRDQPAQTPVYSADHPRPIAFDWQPGTRKMWVVDELASSAGRLSLTEPGALSRALRTSYALPEGTGPSSAAFYHGDLLPQFKGDLFIAAAEGHQLIRLRFDAQNPTRIASVDRLLQESIGPIRVVAPGPDGALYVASDAALYRLRP